VIEPAGYFDARLPGHARADIYDPGRCQRNEARPLAANNLFAPVTAISTEYNQSLLEIVKLYCGVVESSE